MHLGRKDQKKIAEGQLVQHDVDGRYGGEGKSSIFRIVVIARYDGLTSIIAG